MYYTEIRTSLLTAQKIEKFGIITLNPSFYLSLIDIIATVLFQNFSNSLRLTNADGSAKSSSPGLVVSLLNNLNLNSNISSLASKWLLQLPHAFQIPFFRHSRTSLDKSRFSPSCGPPRLGLTIMHLLRYLLRPHPDILSYIIFALKTMQRHRPLKYE